MHPREFLQEVPPKAIWALLPRGAAGDLFMAIGSVDRALVMYKSAPRSRVS